LDKKVTNVPQKGVWIIDEEKVRALFKDFKNGQIAIDEAISGLRSLPYRDLGFAKLDQHRSIRKGFPEVIFGQGKMPSQVASLSIALLENTDRLIVTRASPEMFSSVSSIIPDANYDTLAKTIVVDRRDSVEPIHGIVVASAGTADQPVAQEAIITCEIMDCTPTPLLDVGVAGIHRLLENVEIVQQATVIVVVAGMEGALPSVVSGLVKAPVIAVPTSIGYGSSFEGITPLLAMMNSCSPGVSVVNIDNGFGAGYLASMIARSQREILDHNQI
jgi:NCAIR mutase (PurE)-related protein